jgi:flagellar biosynthetic protein FliR
VVSAVQEVRDAGFPSVVNATALVSPALRVIGAVLLVVVFYFFLMAETRPRQVLENIFSIPELLKKLAFTLALFPCWPRLTVPPSAGLLALMVAAEAALGVTIGVAVGFIIEAFLMAAQALGLQAGFSYASMINPTTDADSGVLLVLAELTGGMLFFAVGLDHQVLRSLVRSLDIYPPGAFLISRPLAETVAGLGTVMFATGLRLAFPVLALLVMVDLALALLGRLQPNLQLLTLAFPAKMLAALALLAWMTVLLPRLFVSCAGAVFTVLRGAAGL